MQTAATLSASLPDATTRFLAELARVPERDPRLALRERLRPGDEVGGFEVVRQVGRGGFGVVFEARDHARRRRVAVKVARPGAPAAIARESLLREVEAARLRHPNIVAVLGGGQCERGPFVVLEYLSGETLAGRLARGPLPVAEVVRIAAAVARGLAHAHARGVLHRDLKPANVFLPIAAEAKVIDFGLARVCGRGGPRGSGTSCYMSPEQRRGGPEDARTDLFALGLLLHEMATGAPLLQRDGSPAPAAKRRSATGELPPALARLVDDLVQDDPALRPSSADEVVRRLETVLREPGVAGRVRRAST